MKILIVEDDADIRDALIYLLQSEGYETYQAKNGKEALSQLDGPLKPDLILLDLFMPVMDGFEFRLKQLENPLIARLPVIVMSADMHDIEKKEQTKVLHYLKKPLQLEDLLAMIKDDLSLKTISGPEAG
jgi:CheY-like chemotaxis protein